jgi:UDP-glucuronate 4-epimerase
LFLDITDREGVRALFDGAKFDRVIHLAAQAGVRHSIDDPELYVDTNVAGFLNILEGCRRSSVSHLIYASSSSVYGSNTRVPFAVTDNVDHPISLYGATKRSNELMAHAYSHLFEIPTTGLRLFTVYGPWGRPDMAYFLFTRAIFQGEKISLFNRGDMKRDFTYIDDVVECIGRILDVIPGSREDQTAEEYPPCTSSAPFRVYNVGRFETVSLRSFVELLEKEIGEKANIELLPMQAGDVAATHADVSRLEEAIGFAPKTSLPEGIGHFIRWFRDYYRY